MDTPLPVIERDDADTELPTEEGDGKMAFWCVGIVHATIEPRLMTRSCPDPAMVIFPRPRCMRFGAGRNRPTMIPPNQSHAVRRPSYHARKDGSAER